MLMMLMQLSFFLPAMMLWTPVKSVVIGSMNYVGSSRVVENLKVWVDFIITAPFEILGNTPSLVVSLKDSKPKLRITSIESIKVPYGVVKMDVDIGLDDVEVHTRLNKKEGFSFSTYLSSVFGFKDKISAKVTELGFNKIGQSFEYSLDYKYNITSDVLYAKNSFNWDQC